MNGIGLPVDLTAEMEHQYFVHAERRAGKIRRYHSLRRANASGWKNHKPDLSYVYAIRMPWKYETEWGNHIAGWNRTRKIR